MAVVQVMAALSLAALISIAFLASLPPAAQECLWTVPSGVWKHASMHASLSEPFSAVSFPGAVEAHTVSKLTAKEVLARRLSHANAVVAGPLTAKEAKVYRANDKALKHYQAAADAAARSGRTDRLVDALVALGEAYLRARRPSDAERELTEALRVIEHSQTRIGAHQELAVDRALGHAKRDLGHLDSALALFNRAVSRRGTEKAEDIAGLLSDIGEIHHFRAEDAESLHFLIQAQDRLRVASLGDARTPLSLTTTVAAKEMAPELHRRMAEALRSLGRDTTALFHYETALRLERGRPYPRDLEIDLIQAGLAKLHLFSGQGSRTKHANATSAWPRQGDLEEAKALLAKGELEAAESAADLAVAARVQMSQGLRGADVATGMNLLGSIRRERERYPEAAEAYLSALTAALATPRHGGGIEGAEAKTAYLGVSYIMPMLQLLGQASEAEALLARAVAIADAAGVSASSPERQRFEGRLRANAVNPSFRMSGSKNIRNTRSSKTAVAASSGTSTVSGRASEGKHSSAAKAWWGGGSDASAAQEHRMVASGLLQPQDHSVVRQKPVVALRGQKNLEKAARLLEKGEPDKAEASAEEKAGERVRIDGGIQGEQVASAMNLLGNIRRDRGRYPQAAEAYLSALTAALATPAEGGGIAGAEANTAYLGVSYIMPVYQLLGDVAGAESLLTRAVAIADAAGVPKSNPARQRCESRLQANAVHPVYRMQESDPVSMPAEARTESGQDDLETAQWAAEVLDANFSPRQESAKHQQSYTVHPARPINHDEQISNTF